MNLFWRNSFLVGIVCTVILIGCSEEVASPESPGNQSNDRISIVNEESDLAARVIYHEDQEVDVEAIGGDRLSSRASAARDFTLELVAEVLPPSIGGQLLQATSVEIKGNFAIVSYGMRGDQYLGGIDIFNLTNRKRPMLKSEALFSDSDINAVAYLNGRVYAAEATGDAAFSSPSVMEVLTLSGHNLILDDNRREELTSYAGTCVTPTESAIYACSGDGGGLTVFDPDSWIQSYFVELHDARWVDVADGKIVVAQGTPGQIAVFAEANLNSIGTFTFAGADIPESKSTVELAGDKAFIAAGSAGVQILSASTGALVGSVPRPDPTALGIDPAAVVSNAVTVDEDLLFISNGEAGVFVAQGNEEFTDTGSEEALEIEMIGQLQFEDLASVNHVTCRNKYLIIAAGLGGLKIVEIHR